jgi:lysophospholipase L1-like esterase
MKNSFTYLALGDSYTIGESVALYESFPYQAVQMVRKTGKELFAPEIIARTGWTTTELSSRIKETILNSAYDFVSLLIGVNNQYRGLPSSQYTLEFEELLVESISKAGNVNNRVFVLSIPDWGLTPFARGRDSANISREIGLFNAINRKISKTHHATYIDITTGSPETFNEPSYLSGDALHPSAKAYTRWAKLLSSKMLEVIN